MTKTSAKPKRPPSQRTNRSTRSSFSLTYFIVPALMVLIIAAIGIAFSKDSSAAVVGAGSTTSSTNASTAATGSSTSKVSTLFYNKACTNKAKATKSGTVSGSKLIEISGIAASQKRAGHYWVHNDSDGEAEIYGLDAKGKTTGTYKISGAEAEDWEDIAISGNTMYVADTGDNDEERETVAIYKFTEPDPKKSGSVKATKITVKYGDGEAHNTEALFVDPKGTIYLVDKSPDEPGNIWKASGTSGTITMKKIGTVGYKSGDGYAEISGADVTRDGKYVAIRTYANIYVYKFSATKGITGKACKIKNPGGSKAEAVGFTLSGNALMSVSEGSKQGIYTIK